MTPRLTPAVLRLAVFGLACLAGCASPPPTSISGPLRAAPLRPPPNLERLPNGAIFRADAPYIGLFTGERRPSAIGDTLKIDIVENLNASTRLSTDTSRENKVASKGPGAGSGALGGALKGLLNLDASASGSDSFKGDGQSAHVQKFDGRIAATVVNVLANGHLVVAGERSIALNSGATVLRVSGIVDPADIRSGNVVASRDVVDARLEALGGGDIGGSGQRGWLQRLLTDSLRVW